MATNVPQAPSAFDLDAVRVGRPVVTGGMLRLADDLAFLVGHNVHTVANVTIPPRLSGRTILEGLAYTIQVPYSRSHGAQMLRIAVELWPSTERADSQTIAVTLPAGGSWHLAGGLDGSETFYNPPLGSTLVQEIVGWANVTGAVVGDLADGLSIATTPSAKGGGIRRVTVTEVPMASLLVSASGGGWDAAATRPGRLVTDGGRGYARGMQRLFYLLDQARANFRKHFTLSGVESADSTGAAATPHWSREAASAGAIDWLLGASSTTPHWYLQPRDLYGSAATTTAWKLRVRYRTSNATACDLGAFLEAGTLSGPPTVWTADSAATRQPVTLAGTSGAWAWASLDVTCPRKDLVRVYFDATGPGAGQLLSLSCVHLLENET